jgi:hypothetical protein
MTEYTYNKHILRCNSCNHINFCKNCYQIVKSDWNNKYRMKNYISKIINCTDCNERLNIDVCQECKSYNCIC